MAASSYQCLEAPRDHMNNLGPNGYDVISIALLLLRATTPFHVYGGFTITLSEI